MNQKERRIALLSLLSTKANEKKVKILETLTAATSKTKTMAQLFHTLDTKRALIAVTHEESTKVSGMRNLPSVKVINVEYLNPHDLLKFTELVFTKESLTHMYQHFA